MTLALTTIKNVELCKVGRHFSALGPVDITLSDLTGAIAAQADPEVDAGAIKLGHTGGLALGDSAPAIGWVENLRLSADKSTLIGDLANVPYKLASIIPTAYRRRSVEMKRNYTTPSGKTYPAALTGLALLGAAAPAVKGLADILEVFASAADRSPDLVVELSGEITDPATVPPQGPGAPESGGVQPTGQEQNHQPKESDSMLEKLRKKLGLPDTATDAEVEAAWDQAEADAAAAADGKGPDGDKPAGPAAAGTGTPAAPAAQAPASTEQIAASADGSTITLSAEAFNELNGKVATLEQGIVKDRHDGIILSAMQAGQIVPANEQIYRELLKSNETVALSAIAALPKSANTFELGADHAENADQGPEFTDEQFAAAGI
ncbi:phage protease [Paeniglutamicibacter sp. R2-26]|uniref:phage protease n=1 Tax=Paeniglutamicibacter sp. R2-26 TaxID=3144417 RepID=UPI003EE4DDA6